MELGQILGNPGATAKTTFLYSNDKKHVCQSINFLKRHRPMNTNIYLKISQMHIGFSDANPLFSSTDIGIHTNY